MPGEDLDGHIAVETGIARPVHFTHTARPQRANDFIRAEFRARG